MGGDHRGGGRRGKTGLTDRKDWARSVAQGIPDDLYWRLTPVEKRALLEELEYERTLQAARIVAGMANLQRRRGQRAIQPTDLVKRPDERTRLTPDDFKALEHRMAPSKSIRA